ncbi:MAG: glucose-inhibited division protein A [Tolypothrix sp. T3-bin4]|nr:glucose-inhibited division protein A [Tolypothrix sp. T3-bin4]
MNSSKLVAIITGAISIILAIAYLILVQLLDYRDMKPAPISQFDQAPAIISVFWQIDKITEV